MRCDRFAQHASHTSPVSYTHLDVYKRQKQAFFKVILPEISPAILSAFLICLTYSIDDFIISYFNCGTRCV